MVTTAGTMVRVSQPVLPFLAAQARSIGPSVVRGGEQATTVGTPAALAVAMLIAADEMCAYRPPGT